MPIIRLDGRLGSYEFDPEGIAKTGGTGRVFKGIVIASRSPEVKVGNYVAIKVLYRDLTNESINILRDEQAAKMKIDHPNLLRMYEFIEWKKRFHTVSEWLDGDTLDTRIQSYANLPLVEIKPIVNAVMDGLQAMHEATPPIIHRDVKPSNIMLCFNGSIKLIDFGTLKIKREGQTLTMIGTILGTPQYSPPEQINGEHSTVDATSDIYAFGNLLFELFTGRVPFLGNQYEVMKQQVESPLDEKMLEAIPDPFRMAIRRCTTKKQKDRVQSILELRALLEDFKENEKSTAPRIYPSFSYEVLPWLIRIGVGMIIAAFLFFLGLGVYQLFEEMKRSQNQPSFDAQQKYNTLVNKGDSLIRAGQAISACECFKKADAIISDPSIKQRLNSFCRN